MSGGTSSSSHWSGAPTWLVDTPRLRDTLDGLRHALTAPAPRAVFRAGETLVHDRIAVADSLREVLARLDAIDLAATRALSGVVREYRPEPQAAILRALVNDLRGALRLNILARLGRPRINAIERFLSSEAPDVLRILGREDDENAHSDLIAWLLNPRRAPIIAIHALRQLTAVLPDAADWAASLADAVADDAVSVRRELVLAREFSLGDDLARVDIVISGPRFVLAIENKVWTKEHSDQTTTYWHWLSTMGDRVLKAGILLSPAAQTPSSEYFVGMPYLALVGALVEGATRAALTETEELVLASYLKTLARHIIPVEMRVAREIAALKEPTK